jgi:hypothetical protein
MEDNKPEQTKENSKSRINLERNYQPTETARIQSIQGSSLPSQYNGFNCPISAQRAIYSGQKK